MSSRQRQCAAFCCWSSSAVAMTAKKHGGRCVLSLKSSCSTVRLRMLLGLLWVSAVVAAHLFDSCYNCCPSAWFLLPVASPANCRKAVLAGFDPSYPSHCWLTAVWEACFSFFDGWMAFCSAGGFIYSLIIWMWKPSVHWHCWLGGRKGIRPVKNWVVGAGVVICLEQAAYLHMVQLIPLPLTVSCSSKNHIGFTFLVPAHPGSPGQRAFKWVCVCGVWSYGCGCWGQTSWQGRQRNCFAVWTHLTPSTRPTSGIGQDPASARQDLGMTVPWELTPTRDDEAQIFSELLLNRCNWHWPVIGLEMEVVAVWYIHVNSSARTCVACASVQYAAQVVVCCHVCVGLSSSKALADISSWSVHCNAI